MKPKLVSFVCYRPDEPDDASLMCSTWAHQVTLQMVPASGDLAAAMTVMLDETSTRALANQLNAWLGEP